MSQADDVPGDNRRHSSILVEASPVVRSLVSESGSVQTFPQGGASASAPASSTEARELTETERRPG